MTKIETRPTFLAAPFFVVVVFFATAGFFADAAFLVVADGFLVCAFFADDVYFLVVDVAGLETVDRLVFCVVLVAFFVKALGLPTDRAIGAFLVDDFAGATLPLEDVGFF